MSYTPVPQLPQPPLLSDDEGTFDNKALAWTLALPDWTTALNTSTSEVNNNAQVSIDKASEIVESANTAEQQSAAAIAARNVAEGFAAGAHADRVQARDYAQQSRASEIAADLSSNRAASRSASASSSAEAANNIVLALGVALTNGLGAFRVNDDGELLVDYNESSISNVNIDNDGYFIISY